MINSKNFFDKKRAEEFAKNLIKNGIDDEDVSIWHFKDSFNQTQYQVKWYKY